MQVELNYGRHTLPVELPDDVQVSVVRKPPMPVLPDPSAAVRKALQEPVGTASLDQLARHARRATIAICDITRPVPNHLFLRPLIEVLLQAGMPAKAIRVLVATGLHRPNLDAELDELIPLPASAQLKKTWRGDSVPNRRSCERREVVCSPGRFRFSRYDGIASFRKFAKRVRAAFSPGSGTFAGEVKAQ